MKQYLGTRIVHAEPANKGDAPGYFVRYPDGYTSWSPKEAFESAYREVDGLNFGLAMEAMLMGKRVARAIWKNNPSRQLKYVPASLLTFPRILDTSDEDSYLWLPGHDDLIATDWFIKE